MNPLHKEKTFRRKEEPSRMDILRLLHWVYAVQRAHEVTGKVVSRLGPAGYGSNMKTLANVGALGCRIDCSNSGAHDNAQLPEEAEMVHDFVWCMDPETRGLIISHAIEGSEPDDMQGVVPKRRQKLRPNGKPVYKYTGPDTKRECTGVVEEWDIEPETVKYRQKLRSKWQAGLKKVCNHFNDVEGWSVQELKKPQFQSLTLNKKQC